MLEGGIDSDSTTFTGGMGGDMGGMGVGTPSQWGGSDMMNMQVDRISITSKHLLSIENYFIARN